MNFILTTCYLLLTLGLLIYSYGFVDLNLTLSSNPKIYSFVTWVQKLVYFNRPLSTQIFIGFLLLFFLLLIITIYSFKRNKITKFPWKTIAIIGLIFSLLYPFLSSDLFKYLFSAKMVVLYHANPHLVTPNTFPDDTWIRFMRWVHTTSPYGPVFTLMTIPYYLLGLGKFVPTMYLYKIDTLFWYLLATWLVGVLAKQLTKDKNKVVISQLFFALNPLVLYEWLGNAHNDAPMITLLLLSLYLMTIKKRAWSFISLIFSIGIKYVTIIFLPIILLKNKFSLLHTTYYLLLALSLAPILYHYSYQYQPWYVTWLVPFAAILGNSNIMILVTAYTFGSLLRYIPFVSTSLWGATPLRFAIYSFAPPLLAGVILIVSRKLRKL